ncbi:MAG: pyruvate:ferredoxin (flavodoxin) oxidoreductase [Pseudomonadota bacterium]
MSERRMITVDGNEAAASVAHRTSEVIAIYPITPSTPMGEHSDEWSAEGRRNIWGQVPDVMEMQSEAGAAGAVHGALQAGALTTTFTASQGLLLMIPNMYKIAGELTAYCMHVAARTVATHALSIFGDHSDVMACRQIGFAMLASGSIQEVHDLACVSHAATLKSRIPFMHFFDGFRTSHEVAKLEELTDGDLLSMMDAEAIRAHRVRALTPDRPKIRGTAQNPDVFFQAREACNRYYDACAGIVEDAMDQFAALTGRHYHLFDYVGHPEAERVIVMMGSGAETAHDTVDTLVARGEKVGLLKVRLFRPFSLDRFLEALPATTTSIAVLDRTKEPAALGEPLWQDVITVFREARDRGTSPFPVDPRIIGGRYGLSSKEFTPAMVKAVLDEAGKAAPKNHFTVGIEDDVTHHSLTVDPSFDIEGEDVVRAVFFGLGADGTVGANKNSIKIIGGETDNFAQGYFVYDSKKSGAITISHLRFGPDQIQSTYLVSRANFVGCHQFTFLEKYDVLKYASEGAVFLLNSPYGIEETWDKLQRKVQEQIIARKIRFFVIDAYQVARDTGMGTRINTIMQTCFFAISGVLHREEAIAEIKKAIQKTYGMKGEEIIRRNFEAVDHTLAHLHQVTVPGAGTGTVVRPPAVSAEAPALVRDVIARMMVDEGNELPVSAFEADGTWPTGTTQWEKRNVALDIPVWESDVCIQCNKCALVCPHAAIRPKVYEESLLTDAPQSFKSIAYKGKDFQGMQFTVQVAPEDCTGCALCIEACPAKDKANPRRKAINLATQIPIREQEAKNYAFFLGLPDLDRTRLESINVKTSQLLRPLFEYSGACAGCGETPYYKLLTQLFGDRALIGNATGCSSIYCGNLPTTPFTVDGNGRGPSWSNSLFEDAAEFGFGLRLAVDANKRQAEDLLHLLAGRIGDELVAGLLEAGQYGESNVQAQRARVDALQQVLKTIDSSEARRLEDVADYLVRKSVWSVGGDGWAYDIGFGGLDHVIANKRDMNILVLDTEVYSNTGGQASKATPMCAAAKFAAAGKDVGKKDLGLMAMSYGHVYVARIAMGAKDAQTVRAFIEADSYPGPSLIIAYSHCIAHGYDLRRGLSQQKLAVDAGIWPLYRFDPRRLARGESPLQMDSPPEPTASVMDFMQNETRFRMVEKMDPVRFRMLAKTAQSQVSEQVKLYKQLAGLDFSRDPGDG